MCNCGAANCPSFVYGRLVNSYKYKLMFAGYNLHQLTAYQNGVPEFRARMHNTYGEYGVNI